MGFMDDEKDERELAARKMQGDALGALAMMAKRDTDVATARWLISGCFVMVTVLLPAGVLLWRAMFNG